MHEHLNDAVWYFDRFFFREIAWMKKNNQKKKNISLNLNNAINTMKH